jgi:hypothetical protein
MRAFLLSVVGCLLFVQSACAVLYEQPRGPFASIVQGGQPKAKIVLPQAPTSLEKFAAAELQRYVARILGAELPVLQESEAPKSGFSFFLGNTRKAAQEGVRRNERRMGQDGFTLRSVRDGLIVFGQDDRGTLFGVYELLERYFDVRWFMPGEIGEYVPRSADLRLGQVKLVFKPSFRLRWVGQGEWPLRQRMNVSVTADGRDVGINWKWHFHTFRILIPPEKYAAGHPEYFALVKGKRQITDDPTHGNQLCTSNPDVVREVARNLIATLDAEPGIEVITLSPNDGGGFCECENCCVLDEPGRDWFAKYSRRLAVFNNDVAKRVRQKHPQVLIKVGAYAMYARPPLDKRCRPESNLAVQLCHLYFCHNHPVEDDLCQAGVTYKPGPQFQPNQEFRQVLGQWRKLSPHLLVYEYYSVGGMAKADLPWPLVHTMRRDIPYYREHGVEGFYTQLSPALWHRLGLNYYLAAKLCWNTDLNVDALLDDYFTKFYGPAAAPMRDYFMGLERALQDWNGCASYGLQGVTGMRNIGPKVFTPKVMDSLRLSLEQGERLAAGDARCVDRVGLVRRMHTETTQALERITQKK